MNAGASILPEDTELESDCTDEEQLMKSCSSRKIGRLCVLGNGLVLYSEFYEAHT